MEEVPSESSSPSCSSSHDEICPTIMKHDNFTSESRYINGALKFFPPMYVQRYEAVYSVLKEHLQKGTIRKVIDFGCAEMGFFLYLKHLPGIEEIVEVDTNEHVILAYASKAAPLNADYLLNKRETPLDVYLLVGSIAEYDQRLEGTDVVLGIEVLEHLEQDVLDKVPYNIFHCIKPKVAIFTTPNADFNVLFSRKANLRHEDHKFEWTRKEFYQWSKEITTNYPEYSVRFFGIGLGPKGNENLGCCTQMAVFELKTDCTEELEELQSMEELEETMPMPGNTKYRVVRKYNYPCYVDPRTDEMKIFHEVFYRLKFTFSVDKYYNDQEEMFEVPLYVFMDYIEPWCDSVENLKTILVDNGFYIVQRNGVDHLTYCGTMSESTAGSEADSMVMDVDYSYEVTAGASAIEDETWDWDCASSSYQLPRAEAQPPNASYDRAAEDCEMETGVIGFPQLNGDGNMRNVNSATEGAKEAEPQGSSGINREARANFNIMNEGMTMQDYPRVITTKGGKRLSQLIQKLISQESNE